jgi:hypothetical protein
VKELQASSEAWSSSAANGTASCGVGPLVPSAVRVNRLDLPGMEVPDGDPSSGSWSGREIQIRISARPR